MAQVKGQLGAVVKVKVGAKVKDRVKNGLTFKIKKLDRGRGKSRLWFLSGMMSW